MKMKRYVYMCAGVIAVLVAGNHLALAGSVTTTMPVTATLVNGCTVSASGVNFGTVQGGGPIQPQDSTGTITVSCGAPGYTVFLGAGNGSFGTSTRGMKSDINPTGTTIRYNLYQDAARTILWGDQEIGGTFPAGTGLSSSQQGDLNVYGRILLDNSPPTLAGGYTDTVLVTLVF